MHLRRAGGKCLVDKKFFIPSLYRVKAVRFVKACALTGAFGLLTWTMIAACTGSEQFIDSDVGNACELTADCGANTVNDRTVQLNCYKDPYQFPGGYCSQRCTPGATIADNPELACPEGSTCVAPREYDDARDDGICYRNCSEDADCVRSDTEEAVYSCMKDRGGRNICVNAIGGNFGEECDGMYQCQADLVCFTGDRFPYGYCSRSCEADSECPYFRGEQGLCIRGYCHTPCTDQSHCRTSQGYACLDIGGGRTFCGNKDTVIVDPTGDSPVSPSGQTTP